jgi:hypothetical protein
MKNLVIIEEIGDISVSASIVNWSLLEVLNKRFNYLDVLTLDNISNEHVNKLNGCSFYLHKKNNLSNFQILIRKRFKLIQTFFRILSGNDFEHYNRVRNIRKFLTANKNKYENIILLSGGMGFSTHQAVSKISFLNGTKIIGVYHDPYPSSAYPEPYNGGNKYYEIFKKRNLQNSFKKLTHIIFPSQRLYEWYLRDYKICDRKVSIIPHAVKFDDRIVKFNETKIVEKFTIVHTGTLLEPRNPKTFIDVFNSFKNLDIKLEFYGSIHKNVYKSIKCFEGNTVLINNKRIPYSQALNKQKNADFLLLIESGAEFSPFLPTKFVDYVNSGKPIIVLTPEKSEISRLLTNEYPFKTTLNNKKEIQNIYVNLDNYNKLQLAIKILNNLKYYFSEKFIDSAYSQILNK